MTIKWTLLGGLIYAAMALYLLGSGALAAAGLARIVRKPSAGQPGARPESAAKPLAWFGWALFGLGSAGAAAAFVVRWFEVDHVPLQNMFEVFLCLGVAIWPLTVFCRKFLGSGSAAANALLGFIILFPAGFIFKADPEHLPPALQSFLFVPHVTAYMLSYVIMTMAAVPALQMWCPQRAARNPTAKHQTPAEIPLDLQAHRLVMLGFPLLTLGLALGSWWGKLAWGDYWNWDPKELWSLISWLVYLAYFHFRYMFARRYPRVLSLFILGGMAAIVLTLLWVSLSRVFVGMHSYAR